MALIEAEGDYINEKQLAKQLGEKLRGKPFNERTLMEWRKKKIGPPAKQLGESTWVYYIPYVEAWLQKNDKDA